MNDELGGILTYKLKVSWDQTSVSPVPDLTKPFVQTARVSCVCVSDYPLQIVTFVDAACHSRH